MAPNMSDVETVKSVKSTAFLSIRASGDLSSHVSISAKCLFLRECDAIEAEVLVSSAFYSVSDYWHSHQMSLVTVGDTFSDIDICTLDAQRM